MRDGLAQRRQLLTVKMQRFQDIIAPDLYGLQLDISGVAELAVPLPALTDKEGQRLRIHSGVEPPGTKHFPQFLNCFALGRRIHENIFQGAAHVKQNGCYHLFYLLPPSGNPGTGSFRPREYQISPLSTCGFPAAAFQNCR